MRARVRPASGDACCCARGPTRSRPSSSSGSSAPTACSCRRPATGGESATICDRHGALLIADEVLSGFGRTGRWFAVEHDGVVARHHHLAKGLTAGYAPSGAVIVHERVARHFDDHVLVVRADLLRPPAGLRGDRRHHRDATATRSWSSARRRWARSCGRSCARSPRRAPTSREVRGLGLLWALELWSRTRDPMPAATMAKLAATLRAPPPARAQARQPGLLRAAAVISEAELDAALGALGARVRRGARVSATPGRHEARCYARASRARCGLLRDGMTIMSGGFGLCGNAEALIDGHRPQRRQQPDAHLQQRRQPRQGPGGAAQAGRSRGDLQLHRQQPGPARAVLAGHGRGRAHAAGHARRAHARRRRRHPGFYTPTGVGTVVEEGKEVREIDGRRTCFERALPADLALVRAAVGDSPATCASGAPRATSTR